MVPSVRCQLVACIDLAAKLRRQTVVVDRVQLRLVPLPRRHSAARQHLPQQTLQDRRRRRQVFNHLLRFLFTAT